MTSSNVDCMSIGLEILENVGIGIGILKTSQSSAEIQVISGFFQVDSRHFEFPGIDRRRTMSTVSALGSLYSKM